MFRALTMLAVAACVAAPVLAADKKMDARPAGGGATFSPYGANERVMPSRFFTQGYRLTAQDYHRLRAGGFSREQVYMIANCAHETGLDTSIFANALYRGMSARNIAYEYGVSPSRMMRVRPEWRTPEWASAVGEDTFTKERLSLWW